MQPKLFSWIMPTVLVCIVMLIFSPMGQASTYGRISHTTYRCIFLDNGSLVTDTTRLGIQFLLTGAFFYSYSAWKLNRAPKGTGFGEKRNSSASSIVLAIAFSFFGLVFGIVITSIFDDRTRQPERDLLAETKSRLLQANDENDKLRAQKAELEKANTSLKLSNPDMKTERDFVSPE